MKQSDTDHDQNQPSELNEAYGLFGQVVLVGSLRTPDGSSIKNRSCVTRSSVFPFLSDLR
jgi:hypothetical protein